MSVSFICGFWLFAVGAWAQDAPPPSEPPAVPKVPAIRDPFEDIYKDYVVDFSEGLNAMQQSGRTPKEMKLSSEANFFTLTLLEESSRAEALVEAAKGRENINAHRQALEMYQKVIDEYPDELRRVSDWGIFVPIAEYCQLRILSSPREHLDFYRTKYDPRAREAYETARQRNSLDGLAEVRDKMLATSYGGRSLLTLGMSALDRGHYLEALTYFQQVWEFCPDPAVRGPELTMSMALCRKMLGMGLTAGERYGLVGHWKLDDATGRKAADSSGYANDGTVNAAGPGPKWTQGKVGGAHQFVGDTSGNFNSVTVPAKTFMDIGVGGTDFSVAFWVNLDQVTDHDLFSKSAPYNANEKLVLQAVRNSAAQIRYTIATESATWETGTTKGGVGLKRWAHVGFVKAGDEVKIFLDGRLDLRETLKAPALKNTAGVTMGWHMLGCLDDVRLYNRALLDREVAELAGSVGATTMTASTTSGEAPLAVEFAHAGPGTDPAARCFWEFGDGDTAGGPKVKHTYALGGDQTALLTVTDAKGAVSVARTTISVKWRPKDQDLAAGMGRLLTEARHDKQLLAVQRTSAPHISADDYVPMPPTTDPLGLKEPVWKAVMPDSRRDKCVYTQPVVTRNSVIYRHKNILYSHSILNGELRWKNDLGGRVVWQNDAEFQWPQEDILVQDGMVFTPMFNVGQTLVAIDEITGRLKWAYGPMVASTPEEANMRFGAAPAGGPQTVYAGYVLDNIEGETHIDSEYGVIAFESVSGRVKWRRPICTMRPGKFSAGFAVKRRNKIRSFFTPPLYHEGTVYYATDSGAVAALDALSGRVKWVMRYPYYRRVHDATLSLHGDWYNPKPWFNQRPLLIGEQLYLQPVDSTLFLCLDRSTGKVLWNRNKQMYPSSNYFAGAISTGELVFVLNGRTREGYFNHGQGNTPPVILRDPRTGKDLWSSPDLLAWEDKPVLKHYMYGTLAGCEINCRPFDPCVRPFLSSDDMLFVGNWSYITGYEAWGGYVYHLAGVDLRNRQVVHRRRYLSDVALALTDRMIRESVQRINQIEDIPFKDENLKRELQLMKDISQDTVPVNQYGPFMPFERVTFERHGVPFELRIGPRLLEMVYDREKVKQVLAGRADPDGLFARAELAVGDSRLREAADLMIKCLDIISSEDLDFRATVNQLLYKVHKELARAAIRGGDKPAETVHCLGMSRTGTTLPDEVETLFALAQAAERRGDPANAARLLQSVAGVYGHYEYPVPEIQVLDPAVLTAEMNRILALSRERVGNPMFGAGLQKALDQLKGTFPVYRSAVSPLPKTLTIRAGELAAAGLVQLQKASPQFAAEFERTARTAIGDKSGAEQLVRLWEFPATPTAQAVVEKLLGQADKALQDASLGIAGQADLRRRLWTLADAARICGLSLPDAFRARLTAPPPAAPNAPLAFPMENRRTSLEEERGTEWLALDRRDRNEVQPDWLFLGGRVRRRLDNKFVLYCVDMKNGQVVWKAQEPRGDQWFQEIRLQGKGEEPGFFEAFVHGDVAIVHGMYDVLAFDLKDGRLRWRYEVPFAFEIKHALKSGDLLILAGQAETLALYLPTKDPRGELAWQEKEEGDLYVEPYFCGDRLVSVRKSPSNLTVRYRATGKLIGRLSLPDLLLEDGHPLIDDGPRELPAAHDGAQLAVTDGWYYIMLDVERMAVVWKRLIDSNDVTRLPPLRFAISGDYLAVVKQDYDVKAIHMLSSKTGDILWRTDPKDRGSPQPIDSMLIRDGKLYGIKPHPGQGFYFAGLDCQTGKPLFGLNEQAGYGGKPEVTLRQAIYGDTMVALVKDRQDYEVKAFDLKNGKLMHTLKVKSTGDFGEHGRVSATVQGDKMVLLGKNDLITAVKK